MTYHLVVGSVGGLSGLASSARGSSSSRGSATIPAGSAVAALDPGLLAGVIDRVRRPGFERFQAQLRSSGYCARPVRLRGEICDHHGHRVWSTDSEPDGVLRKACGNRREAVCPACAERYRHDVYHLIAAGLRGGKGVPDSVTAHPFVFVTLTAPGFGHVHTRPLGKDGKPLRCRPRRDAPVCEHGVRLSCGRAHDEDDACLGQPLCVKCFDHEGAVLWNNTLGELWRRTTVYLPRHLAAALGMTQQRLRQLARIAYVKVAEYQARGLVHVHVAIRIDRAMPDYRKTEIRPPNRRFTSRLLEHAVHGAVDAVSAPIAEVALARRATQAVARDERIRIRSLDGAGHIGRITRCGKARPRGEAPGLAVTLDTGETIHLADVNLIAPAPRPQPATRPDRRDPRLAANAHKLGYRGHCLTKSRRWSTTFAALRQAREQHVQEQLRTGRGAPGSQLWLAQLTPEQRVAHWEFAGVGHLTVGDAFLAAQAAVQAREFRQLAREAL